MTFLQALILGVVQGLTEFLPVSSSGHLALFQHLFGLQELDHYLFFDVVCHLGTLFAIFVVFSKELLSLLKDKTRITQIILGTLPLFPLVLIFNSIKKLFNQPELLGYFFMTTALLLYLGQTFGYEKSKDKLKKARFKDPVMIGLFQALALIPGISRSGSTISGARLLGWSRNEAVIFSFLLAVPAILGSLTLEGLHFIKDGTSANLLWGHYTIGFFSSFIVGIASLILLIRLVSKDKLMYFVWYCLIVGIYSLLAF